MSNQPKQERFPPLKIQWHQGHYAFQKGWMVNTYDEDTMQGNEWQRCFNDAYFENLYHLINK